VEVEVEVEGGSLPDRKPRSPLQRCALPHLLRGGAWIASPPSFGT